MNVYHFFGSTLEDLIGPYGTVRITLDGHAPLWVERFHSPSTGKGRIALSHRRLHGGKQLRDPEILFAIYPLPDRVKTKLPLPERSANGAIPISFRSDITGRIARVHICEPSGRKLVRRVLQQDLVAFSLDWLGELRDLGYFATDAMREVLR